MLLSSVSLSVPVIINPVITFTNVNVIKNYNIDFYKGNLDETKLILKKYLNNEVTLTSEEIIKVIKNCGINIYRIFEETEYQEFMNQYYMFLDKVKDNIDEIDMYSFEYYTKIIDENNVDWRYQIELSDEERQNNLDLQIELEKEAASKLFYVYNQAMSKRMDDDLNSYQEYRKELARLNQKYTNMTTEIGLLEQYFGHYSSMMNWSEKIESIYSNVADLIEGMAIDYKETWNSLIGSPENFAKNLLSKSDEIIKVVMETAIDLLSQSDLRSTGLSREELLNEWTDEFKNQYSDFAKSVDLENFNNEFDWINSEEGKEMSNAELATLAENQLKKDVENQETRSPAAIFTTVTKILNGIYTIDQILFGELHSKSKEIETYVNKRIPQMFSDIKKEYADNNINYTSETEELVSENINSFLTTFKDAAATLDPTGIAEGIGVITFDTADIITSWVRNFDVYNNIDSTIEIIRGFGKKLAMIDPSLAEENETNTLKYEKLLEDYETTKDRIDELNVLLSASDLPQIQNDISKWNSFFKKFDDYLDIEVVGLQKIQLDPIKFLEIQHNFYLKNSYSTQFSYKLLVNSFESNGGNSISEEEMEKNFENLTKLNEINLFVINTLGGEF